MGKAGRQLDWSGKRVLVTGAGGFIGSHLVERLIELGAPVCAFVRYNSRGDPGLLNMLLPDRLAKVEIVAGDLRDMDAVARVVEGCRIVFHLGALIAIPYSYLHPREVVETNVMGTLNVLTAARQLGIERIIHTSTSEVYGSARYAPIDESHPLQAQSPYAASKTAADKIAESFHRAFDVPVVTVRPFNTYGPRQSARAVIPTIIVQALSGDTYHLGNLHPTRDFTYVTDTVEGFCKAAEADQVVGQVVNLGTGKEISVEALAQQVARILGKEMKTVQVVERARPGTSEVDRLCSSNAKARELLGWEPQVTLEQGLTNTIAWITQHRERYRASEYQV